MRSEDFEKSSRTLYEIGEIRVLIGWDDFGQKRIAKHLGEPALLMFYLSQVRQVDVLFKMKREANIHKAHAHFVKTLLVSTFCHFKEINSTEDFLKQKQRFENIFNLFVCWRGGGGVSKGGSVYLGGWG